jgi:hypothetical protein
VTVVYPDLYIASMGRSGSTLIANWLSVPEHNQYIFVEPNLTQGVSPLLRTQLERFNLSAALPGSDVTLADISALLADRKWGVKEVKGLLHDQLGTTLRPRRVVITVRDITEVYLSLVEKHRIQGIDDRFDPEWSRQYCLRESAYLNHLHRAHPEYHVVRYQDFVSSSACREQLADYTGFRGGGTVDFNFDLYNRSYESGFYAGRIAPRSQAYRTIDERDLQAAREVAGQCAGYQSSFGYA